MSPDNEAVSGSVNSVRCVRHGLANVLRDVSLTTLALAIPLGWSLYQTGQGVAYFVEGIAAHRSPGVLHGGSFFPVSGGIAGGPLTWVVGGRILTFDQLVMGLIELGLVLAVAIYVRHIAQSQVDDRSTGALTVDQHTT
jgi:hypothetical protein